MTTNMTILLIPEMNFTCTASVVGFIVSGRDLNDGPHSQVQIWHKNIISQISGRYYRVPLGNIPIYYGSCVAMQEIVGDTYLCILHDDFRVSVQPGDILGLELPATSSDEILFTNRGPTKLIISLGIRISWTLIPTFPLMEVQQLLNNYHRLSLTLHQVYKSYNVILYYLQYIIQFP